MKEQIKTMPFNDSLLIERLRKNPKELQKFKDYLVMEYHKDNDLENLLSCLKIVVMSERGAATNIAKKNKMQRAGVYKALNKDVRPRIDTFRNILNGIGYDLNIVRLHDRDNIDKSTKSRSQEQRYEYK